MKNAIILHGTPSRREYYDPQYPSTSNSHWLPWLQKQLLIKDIPTATPEVPFAYDCNWRVWQQEVERFAIGSETILIGHSAGAGFWIKYLSIHQDLQVDKVILVAPWLDPQRRTKGFFDGFHIDPDLPSRTKGVTVCNSDDDMDDIHETVDMLRKQANGIGYQDFSGYGHFTRSSMKTEEFPELLAMCV